MTAVQNWIEFVTIFGDKKVVTYFVGVLKFLIYCV